MADDVDTDVLVAGAGPVGLWLAAELRRRGVRTRIVEQRRERSPYSRAMTLHARTLELFAMRGIEDRWLSEGIPVPTGHFALLPSRLDLTVLDTGYPYSLFLPQLRTEQLLEEVAVGLGLRVERDVKVTGLDQAGDHVRVYAAGPDGPQLIRARYVVGCDGRRSAVRAAAGIPFIGTEDAFSCVIGDVRCDADAPDTLTAFSEAGSFYSVRIDAERHRLIAVDLANLRQPAGLPLGITEFRETIRRVAGSDFGLCDPHWLTRVGSAAFQAGRYRAGRALVAGDAAHVHFPMGGQGLNLGLSDAANLGWKLAAVVRGIAPDSLLDTYEDERAPVGRAVVDDTLAQVALVAAGGREGQALREMMSNALATQPSLNLQFSLAVSGLGYAYEPPPGAHPLAGRRVPPMLLADGTAVGPQLADAGFCLIGLRLDPAEIPEHLRAAGLTVVPAGPVTDRPGWADVAALAVRPDGYVAWAADGPLGGDAAGQALAALDGALHRPSGQPRAAAGRADGDRSHCRNR